MQIKANIDFRMVSSKELNFFKYRFKQWLTPVEQEKISEFKDDILPGSELIVTYTFYSPVFERCDGETRKSDVSNRVKAVEDCIFNALGIDDRYVGEIRILKRISGESFCDVFIAV
jgi:hypothetical protein